MGLAKNSFLTNSFFIFITRAFPTLANLFVLLYYSHFLPKPVYGAYQNFWIHLYFIYPFACFGIHVLIITYSPSLVIRLGKQISRRSYALYLSWAALVCLAFGLLENAREEPRLGFVIPVLFILFFASGMILEAMLIVFKNLKAMALINFIYAIAFCIIHSQVLSHGFDPRLLFSILLLLTCVKTATYFIMVWRNIARHTDSGASEERSVADIRKLWVHMGFYDILQMVFGGIDKFAISVLLIPALSAIYYNGSQNIPFLPVLLSAAGNGVLLQLLHVNPENEKTVLVGMMNQLARILSAIVFPVFCFLLCFRTELFSWILPDYPQAVPVFAVCLLVLPVKAYSFTTPLQKLHQGAIINFGAVADLILALALIYPFYRWLGLPGVALSFVVSTWLQATFYLVYTAKLLQVSPLKLLPVNNWIIKMFVFANVFIIIHYLGNVYFTGRIPLFLGGMLAAVVVALSLGMELKNRKWQ